jgi:hypothetical protein
VIASSITVWFRFRIVTDAKRLGVILCVEEGDRHYQRTHTQAFWGLRTATTAPAPDVHGTGSPADHQSKRFLRGIGSRVVVHELCARIESSGEQVFQILYYNQQPETRHFQC